MWGYPLSTTQPLDIVKLSVERSWHFPIYLYLNGWLVVASFLCGLGFVAFLRWSRLKAMFHTWKPIELEINLGHIGKVKLCPQEQERQIAHHIWTELITRKAGIPIDLDNDVITEIYDSWYALFQCVRSLVGEICAADLPGSESKRKLIDIATRTLNQGLRPHLTLWHARLRHWLKATKEDYKLTDPQTHQRDFPQYKELTTDLIRVNEEIIQYAAQLKKLIDTD
jgi:hypothetical protein